MVSKMSLQTMLGMGVSYQHQPETPSTEADRRRVQGSRADSGVTRSEMLLGENYQRKKEAGLSQILKS